MGVKGDLGSFVDCLVFKRDANHKLSETDDWFYCHAVPRCNSLIPVAMSSMSRSHGPTEAFSGFRVRDWRIVAPLRKNPDGTPETTEGSSQAALLATR